MEQQKETKGSPFGAFLRKYGMRGPQVFSCIKNPGGTMSGGTIYVADLMYFIKLGKIKRVYVPYITGKEAMQKPFFPDECSALFYEVRQETGIEIITKRLIEVLRQELRSFEDDGEMHTQVFYLDKVKESVIEEYLRKFKGTNWFDHDKGMPLVVPIEEAYHFLPTNHLIAEIEALPIIIKQYALDNKNSKQFADRYQLVLMDMKDELKRREAEKQN